MSFGKGLNAFSRHLFAYVLNPHFTQRGSITIYEVYLYINPLPDDKILDWSKLKQFADDNFKFDENSRKFFKQVQNTVGKGEIARYEQFLLFPLCFQKACFPGASKGVIVGLNMIRYGYKIKR